MLARPGAAGEDGSWGDGDGAGGAMRITPGDFREASFEGQSS